MFCCRAPRCRGARVLTHNFGALGVATQYLWLIMSELTKLLRGGHHGVKYSCLGISVMVKFIEILFELHNSFNQPYLRSERQAHSPSNRTYLQSENGRWGGIEALSRRFNKYRLALFFSICLLMILLSIHLGVTKSPLERVPLAEISRTIQSWSDNVLDYGFGDNYTSEIDEVIAEQRLMLAEEMDGYSFPRGLFNISARSLQDLVPELGGRPVRNLIITSWRSGSTFMGDVLNSHPGNYYHYEPLLDYDIIQIRGEPLAFSAINAIKSLLDCNYTNLDHYLNYGKDHVWLFMHNTRLWEQCQKHPNICWSPEFLNPFCRLFPFQSMKIVRLRLRLLEDILNDTRINVRILLLVRDPRGTLQSRKHRKWCPGKPDCIDPLRLCADLVADYSAAIQFTNKYPGRFRAMRYEDLSVEPFKGVQDLFEFFGLDFHPSVQLFLETHTKVNVGGASSTFRNSKSAPFHWRQDLTHMEVRAIQRVCRPALDYWGYRLTFNHSHQHEFNPLGEFNLE
uniref:(California timema) hypothetical protein n=1 Tax=Timema californicum TaxID=61474 RepID=A0A7R9J277_TIMCA|nr:unnamed protein product [Timema californicum]